MRWVLAAILVGMALVIVFSLSSMESAALAAMLGSSAYWIIRYRPSRSVSPRQPPRK